MDPDFPSEVFADTCVLLNFVQQEWEPVRSVSLIETDRVDIVVSNTVMEELSAVADRREEIYEDLVDFLRSEDGEIAAYDPAERRIYIGANDAGHVRDIQLRLATLEDEREILRRLRMFLRAVQSRLEHLESILEDNTIEPLAPFELELAVDRLIDHSADTKVITDAAAWSADGGSGQLVTLDGEDLLDQQEEIIDVLVEQQGPEWAITICPPDEVVPHSTMEGTD